MLTVIDSGGVGGSITRRSFDLRARLAAKATQKPREPSALPKGTSAKVTSADAAVGGDLVVESDAPASHTTAPVPPQTNLEKPIGANDPATVSPPIDEAAAPLNTGASPGAMLVAAVVVVVLVVVLARAV